MSWRGRASERASERERERERERAGTQLTCLTSSKVQILTHELERQGGDDANKSNKGANKEQEQEHVEEERCTGNKDRKDGTKDLLHVNSRGGGRAAWCQGRASCHQMPATSRRSEGEKDWIVSGGTVAKRSDEREREREVGSGRRPPTAPTAALPPTAANRRATPVPSSREETVAREGRAPTRVTHLHSEQRLQNLQNLQTLHIEQSDSGRSCMNVEATRERERERAVRDDVRMLRELLPVPPTVACQAWVCVCVCMCVCVCVCQAWAIVDVMKALLSLYKALLRRYEASIKELLRLYGNRR